MRLVRALGRLPVGLLYLSSAVLIAWLGLGCSADKAKAPSSEIAGSTGGGAPGLGGYGGTGAAPGLGGWSAGGAPLTGGTGGYGGTGGDGAVGGSSGIGGSSGQAGSGGSGGEECPPGQEPCGSECVDLTSNSLHCGACYSACQAGTSCESGACTCLGGIASCPAGCVDLQTDHGNCGACSNPCLAEQSCVAGVCACLGGLTACGDSCVDTASDIAHCGGCYIACSSGEDCVAGSCQCQAGLSRCGAVCVDVSSDPAHCGACGNACAPSEVCSVGGCTTVCAPGLTRCGQSCVDTNSSNEHCGICDNACPAGQSCQGGVCECPAGQTLCGTQCVDTLSSFLHCGACNNACIGGQTCVTGSCQCPGGQEFCAGNCTDTQTDSGHCGACNNVCPIVQSCQSGVCVCPGGETLCDGACVDTLSSDQHCGACGNACTGGQTCQAGTCSCGPGETLCGSVCADTLTSNQHCGACNNSCTNGQCTDGQCRVVVGAPGITLPVAAAPWIPSQYCQDKAAEILATMSQWDKAGQMVQADLSSVSSSDVTNYRLGSVLSGGNSDPSGGDSANAWRNLVEQYHAAAMGFGIPLLYGIDAVHGHNQVSGAVVFPHNIGLGCTRNPDLVRQAAQVTAQEVRGTAMNWTFAPVMAAARDERWGRTYESFSEDPALVAELGLAAVEGFQGASLDGSESILACAKHFAGDGATQGGDDQGDVVMDLATFRRIAVDQYQPLVNAGVGSIMVSFSSFNGQKMSGHTQLLTDILKVEMGFRGFLISDWGAIQQLPGGSGSGDPPTSTQVATAINAGMDMIMEPYDFDSVVNTLNGRAGGAIPQSRIDDAVTRILTVKCEMGMFEPGYSPYADPTLTSQIGSSAHRAVARQAVRESLVVLKNDNALLPLSKSVQVHVAGTAADSLVKQCGGWTIDWQGLGTKRLDPGTTTGTTILDGIRNAIGSANVSYSQSGTGVPGSADYGIVVVGESPYAEGQGDESNLSLSSVSSSDVTALSNMENSGLPLVVVVVSGRPLIIDSHLDQADAWVAAWLPGTEGDGVADVLFGDYAPSGALSHSWPRSMSQIPINVGDSDYTSDPPLFAFGYGLTY